MTDDKLQIRDYPTYFTVFNPNTGFFMRKEKDGFEEPKYSTMPEMLDISVTNFCEGPDGTVCSMCYKNSTPQGEHMPLQDYVAILDQVKKHVVQIALGGGNPNQHPDFIDILRETRSRGIVPNYTTNGRGMTEDIIAASKKYCGAVAISWHHNRDVVIEGLKKLIAAEITTNIHFILGSHTIDEALKILKGEIELPEGLNALIFLTFKPFGRGREMQDGIMNNADPEKVKEFLKLIQRTDHKIKMGFDSCGVPMLLTGTNINPSIIETCEGARFSGYISEDMYMMPCSFMSTSKGVNLKGEDGSVGSIKEAWNDSETFTHFRDKLVKCKCDCKYVKDCMGGCPLNNKVAYCKEEGRVKHGDDHGN